MPEISIVVPVYNVEKYLRNCIDSILRQTMQDFEIILVDDGSRDSGGAICDEYAQKDSRIQVIHQKNAGLSAARNAGMQRAIGKYLLFCDSDDSVHEKWCEGMYRAIRQYPRAFISCDVKKVETMNGGGVRLMNLLLEKTVHCQI